MKTLVIAIAIMGLATGSAQTATPAVPNCLATHSIDHTKVVNTSTVLFYMRGGTTWQNTLSAPCSGLTAHSFSLIGRNQQLCAKARGISVTATHQLCQLGNFSVYTGK